MSERVEVAVVGAGQAGLATSYWLAEYEIGHVLFERDRPGPRGVIVGIRFVW